MIPRNFPKINRVILAGLLFLIVIGKIKAQDQEVNKKLEDFFFGLSFNSGIEVIKQRLRGNPEFEFYEDPNQNPKNSVTGTFLKNKNLNPDAVRNQLVIVFTGNKSRRKNVSLRWSIDYKSEDLPQALFDYGKIESEFKPYFTDIKETEGVGYHQEEIHSLILKKDQMKITIRMMKYNFSAHTISIEYDDVWIIK